MTVETVKKPHIVVVLAWETIHTACRILITDYTRFKHAKQVMQIAEHENVKNMYIWW